MKRSLKDSLIISTALLTILGCGFGLGRFTPDGSSPAAPTVPVESIREDVLSSLKTSLDLSPEQEKAIAPQLDALNKEILDSRREALIRHYQSLLQFHSDIAPQLNPRQKSLLEANRQLLEQEYRNRFQPKS